MGGRGSGRRWTGGAKATTDDYCTIDVRRWSRDGLLDPGRAFTWRWMLNGETSASVQVCIESNRVVLNYRHRVPGGDWKREGYPVYLDWTPCHLGGERPWFLCPAVGCRRRVAILYGGGVFACRHCYDLAYPSQREAAGDRAGRRSDWIRKRLGWPLGILNGPGEKPPGMHWRTYYRLRAAHDAFADECIARIARRFGIGRPERW